MFQARPHSLLQGRPYLALLWPLLALAACALLWMVTLSRADTERERTDEALRQKAGTYAEAYERYLTRSVAQMDQITMQLKHSWEYAARPALLEDMKEHGMFTDSSVAWVAILDRRGRVLSATRPAPAGTDFADAPFFTAHRDSNSTALRIGPAPAPLAHASQALWFTRRIEGASDDFDGVVILAIDANYFTSFVSSGTLGRNSVLAMVDSDNTFHVEQGAGLDAGAQPAVNLLPADAGLWAGTAGVRLLDGRDRGVRTADGQARVLGWHRSGSYPVTALVALSRDDVLNSVDAHVRDSYVHALLASAFLLLAAALASVLSRRAHVRLREQDEIRRAYRTATESANDGFYMVVPVRDRPGANLDFKIVDCNERGAYFYGMNRTDLIGKRVSELDTWLPRQDLIVSYSTAMKNGFYEEERRMPSDPRLNIRWGRRRVVRVGNSLAVTLQDITERKAHEEQLERLANEDTLTALPNRHWLLQFIPRELPRLRREQGRLALLFIDLDDFKQVNDAHGHAAGDRLLAAAAQRLVGLLRPTERVARFGGDEFIVLLSPCADEAHATTLAKRIIAAFAEPFHVGAGQRASVGASVGISLYPRDGEDAGTLIRNADMAMYAGKNDGKGQLRVFDQSLSHSLKRRVRLKEDLRTAIETDQFTLHYQPRVATATGALLSMEALLRWQHPDQGMIAPSDFVPVAESSDLILQIGKQVIDKACAQLAAWRGEGISLVPVSVNVSPRQLLQGGLARELSAALERHAVPAALLEVEITETAMMADYSLVVAELEAIRALGVKLHIDDFGTGYSSLSQLQHLHMDVLKVDRAFTARLSESKEGKVFFQAIVSMAHALGMSVVAEGVETEEQWLMLRELHCDEVQGYFIARPMDARRMGEWMRRGRTFRALPAPSLSAD